MLEPARPRASDQLHCQCVEDNAFHLSSRPYHALRDPDDRDDRDYPRGKERNRDPDHPQTPHDGPGALRHSTAQRGERTALMRDDVALAVNLDLDVSWRV